MGSFLMLVPPPLVITICYVMVVGVSDVVAEETFLTYGTMVVYPQSFFGVLLMSDLWMWGMTPPPAIVPLIRVSSSSSPRMASCRWRGVIRFTFRSLLAFPANSKTSAVKYSKMAAEYTAAVAPTLPLAATLDFSSR